MVCGVSGSRARALDPLSCLSATELDRFESLNARARVDFLAGRVALKEALRRSLGCTDLDPLRICVENDESGRPTLIHHPHLHCSLAHSHGWGVGAVARRPLGVDVERIRPRSGSLLGHIADAAEIDLVAGGTARDPELLVTLWTLKEAVLKGIGTGLQVAPRDVRICAYDNRIFTLEVRSGNNHGRWSVQNMKIEDMMISVALKGHYEEPLRISWY